MKFSKYIMENGLKFDTNAINRHGITDINDYNGNIHELLQLAYTLTKASPNVKSFISLDIAIIDNVSKIPAKHRKMIIDNGYLLHMLKRIYFDHTKLYNEHKEMQDNLEQAYLSVILARKELSDYQEQNRPLLHKLLSWIKL